MNKIFELKPIDNRKSFYGKAIVIEHNSNFVELKSYETIVARIVNGKFERLWNDYSPTTMRHINAFNAHYGIDGHGKKWWDAQLIVKA